MKRARIILAVLAVGIGLVTAIATTSAAQASPHKTTGPVEIIQVPSYDPVTGASLGNVPVEMRMVTSPQPMSFSDCPFAYFCMWIHINATGPQFSYGTGLDGRCLNIGSWLGVNYNNAVSSVFNHYGAPGNDVTMYPENGCEESFFVSKFGPLQEGWCGNLPASKNDKMSSIFFQ